MENELNSPTEEQAKQILRENMSATATPTATPIAKPVQQTQNVQVSSNENIVNEQPFFNQSSPTYKTLGKVELSSNTTMPEVGWKNIPIENLPSRGMFYDDGFKIQIRAALTNEIRHFSTIDEDDFIDIDDKLNYVIEKCTRIINSGKLGTWKDLLEIDRFYLVVAVRDFTFKSGENRLEMKISCDVCQHVDSKDIDHSAINFFKLDEKLEKMFNPEDKCFTINTKSGQSWNLYLPTLGVNTFIKNKRGDKGLDEFYLNHAPFLFKSWKTLTDGAFRKSQEDTNLWNIEKISYMKTIIKLMRNSIDVNINHTCSNCGSEVTAPFSFQGGFNGLFLIPEDTILSEL